MRSIHNLLGTFLLGLLLARPTRCASEHEDVAGFENFNVAHGAVGMTGWFWGQGGTEIDRIQRDCAGYWRGGAIQQIPCYINAARALAGHTVAFLIAGGTANGLSQVASLIFGTGNAQAADAPGKDELRRVLDGIPRAFADYVPAPDTNATVTAQSLEHFTNSLLASKATSAIQKRACPVDGFTFDEGWFTFNNNHGIKMWCKSECSDNSVWSENIAHLLDWFADAVTYNQALRSQFTIWNTANELAIMRCGFVALEGPSDTCYEGLDGQGVCELPSNWVAGPQTNL